MTELHIPATTPICERGAAAHQEVPDGDLPTPRLIDGSYLLPNPMPGETVRSIWERFHRISNSNSVKETLEVLFGPGARLRSGHCLPSRVAELSKRVGSDHPLGSVRRVIEDHTTLPFHCYFHTTHQREHAFNCLLGERGPASARAALGLAKSPVLLDKDWPAFCPKCLTEDYERYGFSYWRVAHQLPVVAVCPWHGCRLQQLEAKRTNWCGYGHLPPPDLVEDDISKYGFVPVDGGITHDALLRVAKACLHAQEQSAGFPGDWRNQVMSVLTLMGFKSKGGVNHAALARYLEEKHGAPLLQWTGLASVGSPMNERTFRSMLGFQRARQPTILYIMVALAICEDLPAFEQTGADAVRIGSGGSASGTASSLMPQSTSREELAPGFELVGTKQRVDRSAERRRLFLLHRHVSSRVDPIDDKELNAILADAAAGATSAELRAKYRLHRSDLFMLLERDPAARRKMEQSDFLADRDRYRLRALEFLKKHAHLPGDDLLSKLGKRFDNLRRFDVIWYREHFPIPLSAGRRNEDPERMPEIDANLSRQVASAIRILVDDEGLCPSVGDVLARCRATDLFLRCRDSLPKTVEVLKALPE
tara:strand:+ start:3614 stop:5392 length:1779 start_codon:yes stop_codon:yes gene_type:complete